MVKEAIPRRIRTKSSRPDGSRRKAAGRLRALYDRLAAVYGPQSWWPAKTAFEVVVGAYLTQNTAWKSVQRSIVNLETHGVLSIEGLRNISVDKLRQLIRPSGFMQRKAAALKTFVAFLDAHYNGQIDTLRDEARRSPTTVREQLLALPGVGPETADAILLYALDAPAMVVDTYLRRVVTRHGLALQGAKYAAIQSLAEAAFAPDRLSEDARELARHYNEFHALFVQVGKDYCGPVAQCENCPLRNDLRHSRSGRHSP
ncbi:MAG TPA: base excision DNA repair protein [Acidobacteriaceae bacterium]|jgi:endonuclease-3 related protein|nr:base excision DNA repair protein [Acidobacteriaceae bacterium]